MNFLHKQAYCEPFMAARSQTTAQYKDNNLYFECQVNECLFYKLKSSHRVQSYCFTDAGGPGCDLMFDSNASGHDPLGSM